MWTKEETKGREQANAQTCKTLLNCYIRELAAERGSSGIEINTEDHTFVISFPHSCAVLTGKLNYYSVSGEHEYEQLLTEDKEELQFKTLLQWMITELRHRDPSISLELIQDFIEKVENSCDKIELYWTQSAHHSVTDYLSSEQSLIYGHPFHPYAKNTAGFREIETTKYSPELHASFQLCYMAIHRDVFHQEWINFSLQLEWPEEIEGHARQVLGEKREIYQLLPVHPWQYEHVQTIKAIKDYIRDKKIILLGSCGPLAYPTSSVRTVYIPEMAYNIKLPLNIQITNLRRTNSWEQMRRTMDAARYLYGRDCFANDSNTRIAYEEGVEGCCFKGENIAKMLTVAYRKVEFDVTCTFVMSSLIEAPIQCDSCRLFALIDQSIPITEWFEQYLQISLLPIVRAAQEHGIHFEAHLQNTLLTLKNGVPHTFIIRDLEGVSVNREIAVEAAGMSPLFYDKEQCWARTDYYFMVNHLGSLIHAIARDSGMDEMVYWRIVRHLLEQEYEATSNEYIQHLLTADAFLAKKNMISCLGGHSETPAYTPIDNVMKKVGRLTSGTTN
ncbi:hypothetical protein H8B09_10880 [Paenibacillus sp. PR3]|uniref:Siderophore biosynthesis protein n=1 Tax=Paenibacillus terricola TaxID=2763503 RepID=A0ABR8MTG1_9BACL|nr:IucA/IucC family protein [Paenibacillus terricola]MBD3919258.1 hypothetical protein [Paenibacillus terricola]